MKHIKSFKIFESEKPNLLSITQFDSYKNGDYNEAIIDFSNKYYDREEMVTAFNSEINDLINLVILLNNYISQVNNGGHMQYYDNGYASKGSSGGFSSHDDIDHHLKMVELFKKSPLAQDEELKPLLKAMELFTDHMGDYAKYGSDDCETCGGSGWEQEDCNYCSGDGTVDFGDGEETCDDCGGSGEEDVDCSWCDGSGKQMEASDHLLGQMDGELYSIDTDVMIEKFNNYIKKYIDAIVDASNAVLNLNK